MTHEEMRQVVINTYQPGEEIILGQIGASPREYANKIAHSLRERLEAGERSNYLTIDELLAIADGLERGDFDQDLAGQMGYA